MTTLRNSARSWLRLILLTQDKDGLEKTHWGALGGGGGTPTPGSATAPRFHQTSSSSSSSSSGAAFFRRAGGEDAGPEGPAGTACRRDGESIFVASQRGVRGSLATKEASFPFTAATESRRGGKKKARFSTRLTAAEVVNNSWGALSAVPKKHLLRSSSPSCLVWLAPLLVLHRIYGVSLPERRANCGEMRTGILGNQISREIRAATNGNWVDPVSTRLALLTVSSKIKVVFLKNIDRVHWWFAGVFNAMV